MVLAKAGACRLEMVAPLPHLGRRRVRVGVGKREESKLNPSARVNTVLNVYVVSSRLSTVLYTEHQFEVTEFEGKVFQKHQAV